MQEEHSRTQKFCIASSLSSKKAATVFLFSATAVSESLFAPSEGSTALRVSQPGDGASPLVLSNIKSPKNGYVYIYLSNENDDAVYFDNFTVSDTRGRIIEEDHYYAFGLKIAGISSKKLPNPNEGSIDNKNLYNDKELFDDADLDWYDYGFRNYDPQIGRFPQLDPLTDKYPELTPYQYASNEPIANVDMDGLEKAPITQAFTYGYNAAGSFVFPTFTKAATTTTVKVASNTLSTLTLAASVVKLGVSIVDNTRLVKTVRNLNVPLRSEKTSGGIPFTTKSGNGQENLDHATNPNNPVNIDGLFDLFNWYLKAKPHPLKPDLSTPDDALGQLNDVTKELGSGNASSNGIPGSNPNNTYEPNSKIAPTQVWYDGRHQGSSSDTNTHPERFYNRPIYLTDSSGKPIKIVKASGKYNSDTIEIKK